MKLLSFVVNAKILMIVVKIEHYRKPPACSQISKFFTSASSNNESSSLTDSQHEAEEMPPSIHVDVNVIQSNTCDTNSKANNAQTSKSRSPKSTQSNQTKLTQMTINSKTSIKSFFSNDDSLSDFEIPEKIMRKAPKKSLPKAKTKSTRSRAKQSDIRKAINSRQMVENVLVTMTEDQQLEMALALSKNEHAGNIQAQLEPFHNPTTSAQMMQSVAGLFSIKRTASKRHKWNSKCTQLTRRDESVQTKKQRDKVDEILMNNITVESSTAQKLNQDEMYIINSEQLQRACVPEQVLYGINGSALTIDADIRSYYTNNLVETSELKAGVLLKRWSDVPGRDAIYDDTRFSARKRQLDSNVSETIELADDDDIEPASPAECSGPKVTSDAAADQAPPTMVMQPSSAMNERSQEAILDIVDLMESEPTAHIEQIESQAELEPTQQSEATAVKVDSEVATITATTSKCDNNDLDETDDNDRTVALDSNDIQLNVDTLNFNLRSSQQFVDDERTIVVNIPVEASRSPDLFADEDFFDSDPENRKFSSLWRCNLVHLTIKQGNSQSKHSVQYIILGGECENKLPETESINDFESADSDVIVISSNESQ